MKIITSIVAASILLVSCSQYEKTKSGLAYKITSGGSKEKLKQGQFVKMNIKYTIGAKDSVLNSTFDHIPAYIMVDTARSGKHNFTEVITLCAPGDKLDFTMSVDTLKKMGMIPDYNNIFTRKGTIKGKVEFVKVFANEQDVNADYQKEIENEKQKEIAALEKYAKEKNIKTVKSTSGVLVEIENAGSEPKADTGKQVSVFYKGYTVDGKVFDSNLGKDATHKEPYNVALGRHGVIPGWEEGLKYFGKGGKGKLLVPSLMAYGIQGNPPVIPPFANLIFEVEIADVTVAPPPAVQQMPAMPHR
jgi:FKBP-type peptidyl-prolyl cis-trans isomerase